jgi:hypothetical protein
MPSVSVPVAAIAGTLAPVVGGTVASIAAPALLGAGVGALGSAVTGGKPLKGALFGGLTGGVLGGLGSAFPDTMGSIGLGGFAPGSQIPSSVNVTPGLFSSGAGDIPSEADLGITPETAGSSPGSFLNPAAPSAAAAGPQASTSAAAASGLGSSGLLAQGALAALSSMASSNKKPNYGNMPGPGTTAATQGPLFNTTLPTNYSNRTAVTNYQPAGGDWYTYGEHGGGQPQFYQNNAIPQQMAHGGALMSRFARGGQQGYVEGGGDGMSDAIPAKLSDGEYVINADVVSALGNGSNRKGAQRLEQMRHAVMRDRGTPRVVPKKIRKSPLQYLQETRRRKR